MDRCNECEELQGIKIAGTAVSVPFFALWEHGFCEKSGEKAAGEILFHFAYCDSRHFLLYFFQSVSENCFP